MKLQYNIDQLMLRDGQVFAYGWGFVPGEAVRALSLRLEFEGGDVEEIDAEYGRQRDDVQATFPSVAEAQNAGFLVLAGLCGRHPARATLLWHMLNAALIETDISLPKKSEALELPRLAYYKMLARKALLLFKTAGPRALLRKIVRYFSNRPRSTSGDAWAQLRLKLSGQTLNVMVDHDMGGGANIYRDEVIARQCASGEVVVLLGFHIATLQYFVEIFDGVSAHRYAVAQLDAVLQLVSASNVRQIIYNCAVSFRAPLQVPALLIALQNQTKAPLLFLLHDYFAICPSHFLINADGKFCGVPAPSACTDCLLRHRDGFVSLSGIRDIAAWRSAWGAALGMADEIRVFSNASKTMLLRAYPALNPAMIQMVPHTLHTPLVPQKVSSGEGLHIGVVGAVGRHKGAAIVAALAEEIQRRNAAVKITVIGTLEAKVPREIVRVTGPYEAAALPQEIAKSGANVFLFPSIWGETFSYTSHELIAMQLPFACFDFGAQADLARGYENGIVLGSMNAPEILDRLQEFWRRVYRLRETIQ